jgi:hypothetical protein
MVELVNRYFNYLRDVKRIKAEDKFRDYYEYVYQFVMDFLPLEFPNQYQAINKWQPKVVVTFMNEWMLMHGGLEKADDLIAAGVALRHFFQFLQSEGRLSPLQSKKLREATHVKDFHTVFTPPDKDMENSNLLGDVDYSIANYERKRAQKAQILRQQIARQTSAPGFVLLVRHFAEQIDAGTYRQMDIQQRDIFVSTSLRDALQRSGFNPQLSEDIFFRHLIWLCEEMGFIDLDRDRWKLRNQGKLFLTLSHSEIWEELLLGLDELFILLPGLSIKNDRNIEIRDHVLRLVENLQRLPINMWVTLRAAPFASKSQQLTLAAGQLSAFLNAPKPNPIQLLLQASVWLDLLKLENIEAENGAVLKTQLGELFFGEIAISELNRL